MSEPPARVDGRVARETRHERTTCGPIRNLAPYAATLGNACKAVHCSRRKYLFGPWPRLSIMPSMLMHTHRIGPDEPELIRKLLAIHDRIPLAWDPNHRSAPSFMD